MTASCSTVFRLQALSTPGVLPKIFPQDKWKTAISFRQPINMSYKTHHDWESKAQFYYSFLSLSSIASSLRFQVIIVLCIPAWHKLALWRKNQLAGCPSLLASPGHDKNTRQMPVKSLKRVYQHLSRVYWSELKQLWSTVLLFDSVSFVINIF